MRIGWSKIEGAFAKTATLETAKRGGRVFVYTTVASQIMMGEGKKSVALGVTATLATVVYNFSKEIFEGFHRTFKTHGLTWDSDSSLRVISFAIAAVVVGVATEEDEQVYFIALVAFKSLMEKSYEQAKILTVF